jgi:hypothetical protein
LRDDRARGAIGQHVENQHPPGAFPRKDAQLLAGRLVMRMIGAVLVLLVVAGTIEGFVSSSAVPLAGRTAVSAGGALFLVLYLLNGSRAARSAR